MKKAALILGVLMACTGPAGAGENNALTTARVQESPYVGIDYVMTTLKVRNAELEMNGGRLRIGSELNRYLGLEYQATIGFDDDEASVLGGTISTRLKAATGAYVRGKLPLSEAAAIYGLVGYSWTWLEVDAQAFGLQDQTREDDGLSAAVGIEAGMPGKFFVNAEYIEFTEGLTAVAAGVRIPF
jgi:hypothetical protein